VTACAGVPVLGDGRDVPQGGDRAAAWVAFATVGFLFVNPVIGVVDEWRCS
jgi:hypothetical protein